MQKLKRDQGDTFNSILPNLLCILVTCVFVILFTSWIANVTHRQDLNAICRNYILQMESTGYLTDEMRVNLEAELVEAGMTNITIESPTTLTQVEYGEDIYLKVSGKMPVFEFGAKGLTVDENGNVVESSNMFLEVITGTSSWNVLIQKSSISKAPYGTTPGVEYLQIIANVLGNSGGNIYYNGAPTKGIRIDKGSGGQRFTFKANAGYVIDTVYVNSVEVATDANGQLYNGQTESSYTFGLNLQESQTLIVKFRPMTNIVYKVYHYQQNLDGVTYSLVETDTLLGTTNETVVCARKSYEGFSQPEEKTLKVTADGQAYVEYRYNRIQYNLKINEVDYVDTSNSSTNGKYMYGSTITLDASISGTPSEIFTLNGWDGDIKTSNSHYTFTMPSNDVTVTPLVDIAKYTVNFDSNGGTGNINSITNKTYYDEITLPKNGFTYKGYELLGWSLDKNSKAPTYAPGEVVSGLTTKTSITLYAVWGDLGETTYTVNHYVMDSTGTYRLEKTETKDGYTSLIGLTNVNSLICDDYVEDGKISFNHAEIDNTIISSFVPVSNNKTVVNMYYARKQYNVVISTSAHAYVNGSHTYEMSAYYGQDISITADFDNGYEIDRFEITSNNVTNANIEKNNIKFTMPAEDVALRVSHKCIKYTISYDLNGGVLDIENPIEYNIETGTFTINNPVRDHYTFIGWTGTGISSAQLTVTIAQGTTGDISLKAIWLIDSYTLTISYPGTHGNVYVNSTLINFSDGQDYNLTIDYGQSLNVQFVPNDYESIKYLNLTVDNENAQRLVENYDKTYTYSTDCMEHNLDFDLEFFASTYIVRFVANNGTTTTKDQIMTFNEVENLQKNTYTRKGYVFKGWSEFAITTENGQNFVKYQDEESVINLADSNDMVVYLYAVWVDEDLPSAVLSTTNNFSDFQTLTCTPDDTGSGIKDIYFTTEPTGMDPDIFYGTINTYTVTDETTIYVYVRDNAGNVEMYGPVNYYTSTFIRSDDYTVDKEIPELGNDYILTANGNDLDPKTYNVVCPTAYKEDCEFLGWNKDPNATSGVMMLQAVSESAEYYPIFKPVNATLVNGVSFNTAIKQLVNTSANYTTEDNTITSIQFTTTKPAAGTTTVNVSKSGCEVLAYRNGGTIYLYSEAETIYYNPDSSYMFYNIKALTSTDITSNLKFKTTKTTDMSWMFENCGYNNLTTLNLSAFDTTNVTDMEGMFANCGYTKMTTLNLGNSFNTSNVTNMRAMFTNCGYGALTTLNLGSKFNTSKVTDMKSMFAYTGYTNMTSLSLGSLFNTQNVVDTSYMFAYTGYTKMTSLSLGSKFNGNNVSNMNWMFLYCGHTAMTSLDISAIKVFDTTENTTYSTYDHIFTSCGKKNSCTIKLNSADSVAFVKAMDSDYLLNVNTNLITN